jgi:hypothetical protein
MLRGVAAQRTEMHVDGAKSAGIFKRMCNTIFYSNASP